jgi:hypothetical protein
MSLELESGTTPASMEDDEIWHEESNTISTRA